LWGKVSARVRKDALWPAAKNSLQGADVEGFAVCIVAERSEDFSTSPCCAAIMQENTDAADSGVDADSYDQDNGQDHAPLQAQSDFTDEGSVDEGYAI
jgi:hypothetical protein